MYLALVFMLLGAFLGRVCRKWIKSRLIDRIMYLSILGLLFLLGVQTGLNERLFLALPHYGLIALVLSIGCIAGSMLAARLLGKSYMK